MPRYDYECTSCHHRFEVRQSFDSEPVADCPECGKSAQRRFHSPTIIYKGSGWYTTDYAKKPMQIGNDGESEGAAKPAEEKQAESSKPSSEKQTGESSKPSSEKQTGESSKPSSEKEEKKVSEGSKSTEG